MSSSMVPDFVGGGIKKKNKKFWKLEFNNYL